jgi:hypothetical protein
MSWLQIAPLAGKCAAMQRPSSFACRPATRFATVTTPFPPARLLYVDVR